MILLCPFVMIVTTIEIFNILIQEIIRAYKNMHFVQLVKRLIKHRYKIVKSGMSAAIDVLLNRIED